MPSATLTVEQLSTLKSWPHLNKEWHFLSAVALTVLNKPAEVAKLYQYVLSHIPESEHEDVTAKIREAVLKSAGLIGVPRVINASHDLYEVTPENLRPKKQIRAAKFDWHEEGIDFLTKVYKENTERVSEYVKQSNPDLYFFTVDFLYGPLFSPLTVLSAKETSLTVVSSLLPQDANRELKLHLRGAVHNGATVEEVNSLRDMLMQICSWFDFEFSEEPFKL